MYREYSILKPWLKMIAKGYLHFFLFDSDPQQHLATEECWPHHQLPGPCLSGPWSARENSRCCPWCRLHGVSGVGLHVLQESLRLVVALVVMIIETEWLWFCFFKIFVEIEAIVWWFQCFITFSKLATPMLRQSSILYVVRLKCTARLLMWLSWLHLLWKCNLNSKSFLVFYCKQNQ